MGWGTTFTAEVYLNRQTFEHKYELTEKIKELEGYIESAKRELIAYAVATPRDIVADKNEEGYTQNPINVVLHSVQATFEWREDKYRQLHKLYQYEEYLQEQSSQPQQ
jgi:predicted nuclease with TOPRIM domain